MAKIGDILTLCLKGDATDVELTGIQSAKVEAADDYVSNVVSFVADGEPGTDNFVTTTSVENGELILKTLLVPAYFDALNGGADGFIQVSGTVLIDYIEAIVRRRSLLGDEDYKAGKRMLQGQEDDKSPFSIGIPLGNPVDNPDGVPDIAQGGNLERSSGAVIEAKYFRLPPAASMIVVGGGFFFL